MVAEKLHHGLVKTPPWWSANGTMVEWERHHGEISPPPRRRKNGAEDY